MDLFLNVIIFLIVAAALGFAVGWLVRGSRDEEAVQPAATVPAPAGVNEEREGLHGELQAAHAEQERLQSELAEARAEIERQAARIQELEAAQQQASERIAALERELESARAMAAPAESAAAHEEEGAPPPALSAPEGEADDLKKISGIGPAIEKTLHEFGIFHFRQIAAFTPENIAWLDRHIRPRGRIEREDWVGQARTLAAGGETEFSRRQAQR